MEAPPRFELGHGGFADLCLTTWLWCRILYIIMYARLHLKMHGDDTLNIFFLNGRLNVIFKRPLERITRLELATSTLARWRSTR